MMCIYIYVLVSISIWENHSPTIPASLLAPLAPHLVPSQKAVLGLAEQPLGLGDFTKISPWE